jgi:hypothetical protein
VRHLLFLALAVACSRGHAPTWTEDVEPLVQAKCNGCHALGGIAPVMLDSYLKAKIHGPQMARAVAGGTMPPWPPGGRSPALKNSRALDPEESRILQQWVASGMPRGPDSAHRERAPEMATLRADLNVAMAEPYLPKAELTDDYRCFIIDPHATASSFVTGYEIHPGSPGNVHHVILFEVLNEGNALQQLQALDDADPGPGYTCFGGPMIDTGSGFRLPPYRFVGGWAPGTGAAIMPQRTGIKLEAGARLLMQVHYNQINGRNSDLTTVSLQLDQGAGIAEALVVPIPDSDFHIPPGAASYSHQATHALPSWVPPLTVHSVYPHMHLLGTSIAVSVVSRGTESVLIEIPRWDFHWQGAYLLQTPVKVAPGDSLRISCSWDNTAAHQPVLNGVQAAPRHVYWGEKTTDEMCLGFLYVTF